MTLVRIRNATGRHLDSVRVRPPQPGAAPVEYGPLADGATSEYLVVPDARSLAAIEAAGPDGDLVLQPYDMVGAEPLGDGHFTYQLSTPRGRLSLDVTTDDFQE